MSSISSAVSIPSTEVRSAQGSPYDMQVDGSVYEVTKSAAADGESQSFYIDSLGRLHVLSSGQYNAVLPTLADGDKSIAPPSGG
jgi:hypothetical protein